VLVGDARAWLDFSRAYKEAVWEMHSRHKFVGKDQDMFFLIVLHRRTRELVKLFLGQKGPGTNEWESFLGILSGTLPPVVDERFIPGYVFPRQRSVKSRQQLVLWIVAIGCLIWLQRMKQSR
jgi:hypothetical protein